MLLDTYLKRQGAMSLTTLSDKIGVSKGRLSQLRNSKEWPPELALKAEEATLGILSASKLSPVIKMARAPAQGEAA